MHPDDRGRVKQQARSYVLTGEGPFEFEFRALRRDGSTRWIVMRADVDRVHVARRPLLVVPLGVPEQRRTPAALRVARQRPALITPPAGPGTRASAPAGRPAGRRPA